MTRAPSLARNVLNGFHVSKVSKQQQLIDQILTDNSQQMHQNPLDPLMAVRLYQLYHFILKDLPIDELTSHF